MIQLRLLDLRHLAFSRLRDFRSTVLRDDLIQRLFGSGLLTLLELIVRNRKQRIRRPRMLRVILHQTLPGCRRALVVTQRIQRVAEPVLRGRLVRAVRILGDEAAERRRSILEVAVAELRDAALNDSVSPGCTVTLDAIHRLLLRFEFLQPLSRSV